MSFPTLRQVFGNIVVAAHLPGQRRWPFTSPERIAAARDRRVRRTVRWAAARIPYYRDALAAAGLKPADVRTADDLRALPLLVKDDLRAAPERFTAAVATRGGLAVVSSGTTGARTTIFHDPVSLLANAAWGERERAALVEAAGGAPARELAIVHGGATVLQVWQHYARTTWTPGRAPRTRLDLERPLEEMLAAIERERPDVVLGYGSALDLLFRAAAARGLAHRPRAVVYGADALPSAGREIIERELGIAVLATYSAAEAFKIGFSCAAGRGFHVHADLCHVRLVDERGADVPPGVPGEVTITNLVNRATVLVNHRLGDVGAWQDAPCPCGRTLPRLELLEGRDEPVLRLAGGRVLHPGSVWQLVKQHPDVLRFQLVQHAPDHVELRLLASDPAAHARVAPALVADLRALVPGVRVDATFAPGIAHAAGKFRRVVVTPEAAA